MKLLSYFIIVLLVLTMGCQKVNQTSPGTQIDPSGHSATRPTIMQCFNSAARVIYKDEGQAADGEPLDYWKTPMETYKSGEGDCEDQSLYLQQLMRRHGYNAEFIVGMVSVGAAMTNYDPAPVKAMEKFPMAPMSIRTTKVTTKPIILHAWVETNVDGDIFVLDPTAGVIFRRKNMSPRMYIKLELEFIRNAMKAYKKRAKVKESICKQYGL